VSLNLRTGQHFDNPSLGYGGHYLPKDTKRLPTNYFAVPHSLIGVIVDADIKRKDFVAFDILKHNPSTAGLHRQVLKADSDNFRDNVCRGSWSGSKPRE
jgi:UDPglucose 6-dehydrogenase